VKQNPNTLNQETEGWKSASSLGLVGAEAEEWSQFIGLMVSNFISLVEEDPNTLCWSTRPQIAAQEKIVKETKPLMMHLFARQNKGRLERACSGLVLHRHSRLSFNQYMSNK
jgi:hypothetical protein